MFAPLITALHLCASLWVALYALAQLHLLARSARPTPHQPALPDGPLPRVLVQLPLRNERSAAAGLLRSVAALRWPALTVQVLDDSDDETVPLVAALADELRRDGLDIHHVRRGTRQGYKAGALAHGLTLDDAPFVLVLDADFRPAPDFVERAMAVLLAEPELGLVQARWAHRNASQSWLTRAQALHLDAHFTIEQQARSRAPLFMGFNGTAGIWRRQAIEDAGGWSADTLTEDLDLSYRAQLAGWRMRYVDALSVSSELPADLPAIRTQQHRWMKGGAQVAVKLLGTMWRAPVPWVTRLQATAHLAGGTVFFAVLVLCATTPVLLDVATPATTPWLQACAPLLELGLVTLLLTYGTSCVRRDGWAGLVRVGVTFVPFLALSTGMAVHNAQAVLEGLRGVPSPFVRTPKRGEGEKPYARAVSVAHAPELVLGIWGLIGLVRALAAENWVLAAFLGTQCAGLLAVGLGGRWPALPLWRTV